jgi:uncharacterized protein (TIGR03435 family)
LQFQPGRLRAANMPVEDLVSFAHGVSYVVRDRRIVGWPSTGITREQSFDIEATLSVDISRSRERQQRAMLELLAMRFGYRFHIEQRPMNAYRLVLVNPGLLGPALRRVDFNCAELEGQPEPVDKEGKSECRGQQLVEGRLGNYRGSGTIQRFISYLEVHIKDDRPIVDATGLEGSFVWDYDSRRPIITSLEPELGLKLQPAQVPVPVVVIDAIQAPTPN